MVMSATEQLQFSYLLSVNYVLCLPWGISIVSTEPFKDDDIRGLFHSLQQTDSVNMFRLYQTMKCTL